MENTSILIIGLSKVGKTHFGGQLYGRLKAGTNDFALRQTPNDLSIFQDILDNLNEGLEGKHTDSKLHETIVLPIISKKGNQIDLIYPDYGGEQLRNMIEQRKINSTWTTIIRSSTSWFLFIRLDLIENISDITTKFYQQIEEEKQVKVKEINITDLPIESSAFYIELLQTFLYAKGTVLHSKNKPKLTILLSCWDKSDYLERTKPSSIFEEKLPLLSKFIESNWDSHNVSVIGLSSLSRDLNSKIPDKEFANEGPENFGYIIEETGERQSDITRLLNQVSL